MLDKRKDFPFFSNDLIYLDSAATTQKPQSVIDTISETYSSTYGTVHRAVYDLVNESTEKHEAVRVQTQKFIGASSPSEIIFTKGTTESINLIASSFIQPGDEILVSTMEHHANIVPWQLSGATLHEIPIHEDGTLDLEIYKQLLERKPKLVAITHVSNVLGTVNPIDEMATLAHAAGAYILVDGAQAAPHLPINVQNVDFYAFSGHKIYGPSGIGVLYGKEKLLEEMPPYQGGGDMIDKVTFEKTTFQKPPLKFEAGTPPIAQVRGLGAAITYLQSIGLEKIAAWEHKLYDQAQEALSQIDGLTVYGTAPNKSPVLSFNIKGVHPLDLGTLLNLKGICIRTGHLCAQPIMKRYGVESMARVSFGLYNTPEEVNRFITALTIVLSKI